MNNKLLSLLKQSVKTLQSTLSKDELFIVKSEFAKIYDGKSAAIDSYLKLSAKNDIDFKKIYQIEDSFYTIANLISLPYRDGATSIIDKAYKEDVNDPLSVPFPIYQVNMMGEAYDQVIKMMSNEDIK